MEPQSINDMPGETTDKIKKTQESFPGTEPGSVGQCSISLVASPVSTVEQKEKGNWIEIALVGTDDKPVPGAVYSITLPDGQEKIGRLDENGMAGYYELASAGNCIVTFPELDKDAWA